MLRVQIEDGVCLDCGGPLGATVDEGDGMFTVTCQKCDRTFIISVIAVDEREMEQSQHVH